MEFCSLSPNLRALTKCNSFQVTQSITAKWLEAKKDKIYLQAGSTYSLTQIKDTAV